jgi:DNA-binding response OmpR family regulator
VSNREAPTAGPRGSAATILVVDDDTQWVADLQTWLSHEGYQAVGIARGEWVIQAVEFHEPNVVLLDLHFPGADGWRSWGTSSDDIRACRSSS